MVLAKSTVLSWRSLIAGSLAAACWGLGTVLSKALLHQFLPLLLLVVQLVGSLLFLWTVTAMRQQLPPLHWRVLKLGLTGLLEPGLTYVLGMIGLTMTTASSATLIGASEPIWVVLLAALLLGERITWPVAGTLALALLGVGLIVGTVPTLESDVAIGNLLICLSAFSAATYVVLTKRLVIALNPMPLAALQQTFGLGLVGLGWLGWGSDNLTDSLPPSGAIWAIALISGVLQYALPFWFYLVALQGTTAAISSLFLMLIPLFGVSGAYVWLGEQPIALQGIGALLILIAIAWLSRLPSSS
jgi:drug/metabolite transporter (DMT)-like permease